MKIRIDLLGLNNVIKLNNTVRFVFILLLICALGYLCKYLSYGLIGEPLWSECLVVCCVIMIWWFTLVLINPGKHIDFHRVILPNDLSAVQITTIVGSWKDAIAYTEKISNILRTISISCIAALILFQHFFSHAGGSAILYMSTIAAIASIYCSIRLHIDLRQYYHLKEGTISTNDLAYQRKKLFTCDV